MKILLYYWPMLFVIAFVVMIAIIIRDSVFISRKRYKSNRLSFDILGNIKIKSEPCRENMFSNDIEPDFSGYLD